MGPGALTAGSAVQHKVADAILADLRAICSHRSHKDQHVESHPSRHRHSSVWIDRSIVEPLRFVPLFTKSGNSLIKPLHVTRLVLEVAPCR